MCCGGNIQNVPIPRIDGKKPMLIKFPKSIMNGIEKIRKKIGINKTSKATHS